MCQQHLSSLARHILAGACCGLKRFWLRLHAVIRSCHLRLASPEVDLFAVAGLLNTRGIPPSDDLAYLITCRRMGASLSGRTLAKTRALAQHGRYAGSGGFDQLKAAPGRRCTNGATSLTSFHTQQGHKGINQDAMLVWEGDDSIGDMTLCGVFDGHGPFGHLVAQSVRDSLPSMLVSSWQVAKSTTGAKEEPGGHEAGDEGGCSSEGFDLLSLWKQLFPSCYRAMDKELFVNPRINCFNSGTTAVVLIKQGSDVVIGNVGDSRAVLGTKSDDGSLLALQLTVDLKPNLPKEAERIRNHKGRVFALRDEPAVPRVWLPHINSPGLAMSRALGDFCLKDFGVTAVPDVIHRRVTERDQFIVLATDGIWDALSNEQVVQIVSSVSERQLAARAVVDTAVRVWRIRYPISKIDDCAVVCLYVNDHCMK